MSDKAKELLSRLGRARRIAALVDDRHKWIAQPDDPILLTLIDDVAAELTRLAEVEKALRRAVSRHYIGTGWCYECASNRHRCGCWVPEALAALGAKDKGD